MRRYSPGYYSPPRRGYSSRGRSPPPRGGYSPPRRGYSPPRRGHGGGGGGGGGFGRRKEPNHGSLLVRNIPLDCRPDELRVPFERFGLVRDVYIPKDYYTGEPRGFAFVQFVDSYDASEAQYHMNGQIFAGREISVVVASESRKRPEDMRRKTRQSSGGPRYGGRRSAGYSRRSRSRSVSRSRSPRYRSGSKGGHRSRSYSASPKRRDELSASPSRRPVDRSRSPREDSPPRGGDGRRSYSPDHEVRKETAVGKAKYEGEEERGRRDSPRRVSRSPSGSRSRSVDASPAPSR
ncbi:serine/arginine-rich SC35-like splicing factor SCL30 [Spinacia oleracea]|uniref:Serine/arginine-rich SC35-like splicing factor SCL30 n=1 Tax=Spinacia oleracea TaxID=3562 RepID=A0A9R0IWD2_SPIOL|nr:serine/arginine-rich SC35-like splicing factor SCL30 [Spinacia oleracea]XP_056696423.1 serine/arginine-rich SC35-like splicing factor SCL30 [Spinacia oleracea]